MANASVERFKNLTEALKKEVHDGAVSELLIQATDLAALIESVAPVREGVLKHTVRVIPDKTKDTVVRIVAGGQETRSGIKSADRIRGREFDYARADEFGTIHMAARPFFFPTYRLRKKKIRAAMRRKITAAIKKRSAE